MKSIQGHFMVKIINTTGVGMKKSYFEMIFLKIGFMFQVFGEN